MPALGPSKAGLFLLCEGVYPPPALCELVTRWKRCFSKLEFVMLHSGGWVPQGCSKTWALGDMLGGQTLWFQLKPTEPESPVK